MAREIRFQNFQRTGQTIYAVIDFQGLRWDGASFVTPTAGAWPSYAVAMTEDAGTGHFTANVPAGITVWGRLDYRVYKQSGASPDLSDNYETADSVIWSGELESAYDIRYSSAVLAQGQLAAATATTATLGPWGPALDIGDKSFISILSGTGAGQAARITSYNPATKVATIENSWIVTPDATSRAAIDWQSEWRAALTPAGLDAIAVAAPSGAPTTLPQMLVRLYRRFFARVTQTSTQLKTYADDGTTVLTTQALGDDGSTLTQSAAS